MDVVLFVRTKAVNLESSLRQTRRFASAEFRDIDAEAVGVVSVIALDEMSPQEEVEMQSSGCSFVRENKSCKP